MSKINNYLNDLKRRKKESCLYLALKKLSALLRETTSKYNGDFYFLNYLHSFSTKSKLKSHEKVCKDKDFCGIMMLFKKGNISKFSRYMKSDNMPYINYDDLETLIKDRWMSK